VRSELLDLLVEPGTEAALELDDGARREGDEIVEGRLRAASGRLYPIVRGIPRFVDLADEGQEQTQQSFGFKWGQYESLEREETTEWARGWLVDRYGFDDASEMRRHFASAGTVLDAGCGGGYSASLWLEPGWVGGGDAQYVGVDISEAVDVARHRLEGIENVHFVQADVLHLPFRRGSLGAGFSEGVLHHTPSTEDAFASLASVVADGGELMAYVYRRKGPIREYADDLIRDLVAPLPPDEGLAAMRPLTALARSLSEAGVTITVPEDIPYLQIAAGEYDLQRFIYWHVMKAFWNDSFSFDGNNLVNFDWYHPRYAHRQTEEDVRGWCDRLGIEITHFDAQESGFTVRGRKGRGVTEGEPAGAEASISPVA
jgi:SAM-dependent methyltransferase